jgi:ubiquinone/menaquinone biosynthesis C-methylase UbiE
VKGVTQDSTVFGHLLFGHPGGIERRCRSVTAGSGATMDRMRDRVDAPAADLESPVVSPQVYDAHYYRQLCIGSEVWSRSDGADAHPVYDYSLDTAGLRAGEALVDIGTGRGELVAAAMARGAKWAIGVEYSLDAVAMGQQTLAARGVSGAAAVLLADARRLPLPDACADLVTMLDVVEHLTPDELSAALREARRVLKPGGRVVVHTYPTSTLYDVTYRGLAAIWPRNRSRWPSDPRNDWERLMHVNEQSQRGLRRALQEAGFGQADVSHGDVIYLDFVPSRSARRVLRLLARVPWVRRLVLADLWATAR